MDFVSFSQFCGFVAFPCPILSGSFLCLEESFFHPLSSTFFHGLPEVRRQADQDESVFFFTREMASTTVRAFTKGALP